MIGRLVNALAGETDDGVDAAAGIAILVLGFFFGWCLGQLVDNNRLLKDVRTYLLEQRRLALAAAQREMAAKERPNA